MGLGFAAEKRRSGAEIAAHGAADRRNDGGRHGALGLWQLHSQGARVESGNDLGMPYRRAWNLALPPKNAEVVQKLQPMGQPTDGMMVAATAPLVCGSFIPRVRASNPEMISGCRIGALGTWLCRRKTPKWCRNCSPWGSRPTE